MRTPRWRVTPLCRVGVLGTLLALAGVSCEEPPPAGPLLVYRVTLLDKTSRNQTVFSDTSAPRDCDQSPDRETRGCQNEPLKDRYGLLKSPPTPDSGQELRVVFNKLPLRFGAGSPGSIDDALATKAVVDLTCEGCSGVPALRRRLIVIGSNSSGDPLTSPYGPAIALQVDPSDPLAALVAGARYRVSVLPELADRNGERLMLDASSDRLLSFQTEPFRVLQVGTGQSSDTWVYASGPAGTAAAPFKIAALPKNGVIALRLNAPIDAPGAADVKATFTPEGGAAMDLKVKATRERYLKDACGPDRGRFLYITADAADGLWAGGQRGALQVSIAAIRDLSQAAGHPGSGQARLADLQVNATLTGADAAAGALVQNPRGACPGAPTPMMMQSDGGTPSDGGTDL